MRRLLITTALIICVVWLGYAVDADVSPRCPPQENPSEQMTADAWRRTADGWELCTSWRVQEARRSASPNVAQIHPGLIASFQLLASLGGLLAFSNTQRSGAQPS